MAQTQPLAPYDPVKSVVGMWNGTITRLGYFFKDPANYGEQTKAVLNSTSRRYQDALDDCEIQILEAKWYLEYQLRLNEEKRGATQAEKEDATSAKRKLAKFQEAQPASGDKVSPEEPTVKRQRVEEVVQEPEELQASKELPETKISSYEPRDEAPAPKAENEAANQKAETALKSTDAKEDSAVKPANMKEPPDKSAMPAPVNTSTLFESRPSTSYGGRGPPSQSGQNTPATVEEFNFESMFGEASGDPNETAELNFDNIDLAGADQVGGNSMDAGGFIDPNAFNLGDTSLNNLLPGLESYVKQSGDNGDGVSGYNFGNPGDAGGSAGNEFALPDLGTNTFDDFLNDNTFGEETGDGGDDFLKDGEMMNLDDLDASFFDTA